MINTARNISVSYNITEYHPTITMLICARNEAGVIGDKLDNAISLNYPSDKYKIIVAANGCTDDTASIVNSYSDKNVSLIEFGEIGKTETQNRVIKLCDSEIVVFSDANTPYNEDALLHLVAPFQDTNVGAVSGRHIYTNLEDATGAAEATYWNTIETRIKRAESNTGGLIGANGSIYAVRRELYVQLPSDVISDFLQPLLIAANGFRTVYAPDAHAYETSEKSFDKEYTRKVRIVQRTVYSLSKYPWLLNPKRVGRLSVLIWSHKVLRWLTPFLLLLAVLLSIVRLISGKKKAVDTLIFVFTTLFGFMAILGRGLGIDKPIPGLTQAYYVALMFQAAIVGVYKAFTEGENTIWDHAR